MSHYTAIAPPETQRMLFGDALQAEFESFHAANPKVYELLVKLARKAKAAGRQKYSMDALFHLIRWHVLIETRSDDEFKLNDHFTSRYARLIDDREADLKGFFELRRLSVDR